MKVIQLLLAAVLAISTTQASYASDEHSHDEEKTKDQQGPHGGTLLSNDNFALEITIYEQGMAPEMRIFAYQGGEQLDPGQVDITVKLNRLGGDRDRLTFIPEQGYLVSEQTVTEPHSFDVSIAANHQQQSYQWDYPSHEGRTSISARTLEKAGVETAIAGARLLAFSDQLFGVIATAENQLYTLSAPYPSMVEQIHVQVGDQVNKGQTLATLRNIATVQSYPLKSPSNGEVTARLVNVGARVEQTPLLEVTDLSTVWVEMSAFPESIEKLAIGQAVSVEDMHQHESAITTISYISPTMTGGHIARARAQISNPDGHWRPGMHIKANIEVARRQVPLAVRHEALQNFRGMPVVFAKFGDQFEVRMLELGESNGDYVEVLGGLKPGTEYVTKNSFLLKADVLKDGASHDH